jgi:hypothetical protein
MKVRIDCLDDKGRKFTGHAEGNLKDIEKFSVSFFKKIDGKIKYKMKKTTQKSKYGGRTAEIIKMLDAGFFNASKTPSQIKDELKRKGKKKFCLNVEVSLLRLVGQEKMDRKRMKDNKNRLVWGYYKR